MKVRLNGASNIAQQTLDLNNAEALRFVVLSITPDLDNAPDNVAELRPLTPDETRANELGLTVSGLPSGKTTFWMGNIYVQGHLTPAMGYR
jgi:hypothetical protein